jgi:chromosome segregation protein
VFDEINNRFVGIEGDRKKYQVKIEQNLEEFKNDLNALQFKLDQKIETITYLDGFANQLSNDLHTMNNTISEHKNLLINEMNKLQKEFESSNDTYKSFVMETEEKASASLAKVHSISISQQKIEQTLEVLRKDLENETSNVKMLQYHKLDLAEFEKYKNQSSEQQSQINSQFEEFRNMLLQRDTFVDRIYPLRVYCLISDALHA